MEANRKESCDFEVEFNGETWHITSEYIMPGGRTAWFDGNTCRRGIRFYRTFSTNEIKRPEIESKY